ncbi:MAG: hypothetical protein JW384_01655 [Nitrosomonadaceae bacterium]|nr:hypothetical protein [Nitrosomonadaceae bacterium]
MLTDESGTSCRHRRFCQRNVLFIGHDQLSNKATFPLKHCLKGTVIGSHCGARNNTHAEKNCPTRNGGREPFHQ